VTDVAGLDGTLGERSIAAYVGFDCTAPSLHIGHLLPIMMLRWLQRFGHRPIVVVGTGTTRIGDPTGKDTARPFLTDQEIVRNSQQIEKAFKKFLDFSEDENGAVIVDNYSWFRKLGLIEMLTRFGARFPMKQMLSKDSVQL
jgi:tyrosyl-tRNA synthetase